METEPRTMILAGLHALIRRPPARIAVAVPAPALPPGDPPLSQPRLMLLLSGRHRLAIAGPEGPTTIELSPAQGLHLVGGAWLQRQHASSFRLLGLVCHRGFLRALINHHRAGERPHPPQCWYHTTQPLSVAGWQLIQALESAAVFDDVTRQHMLLALLHICRDLLSRDGDVPAADSSAKLYHAMLAFLEEHCLDEIDRNHLARHFDVHPNHVSRCFARHGDESFARTVIRLRMEHARALLRHGDLSVGAIATACGYASAEYFVTEFRRFFGCPPGQLRARFDAVKNR